MERKFGGEGGLKGANMNVRLELVKEFSICSVGIRLQKLALSNKTIIYATFSDLFVQLCNWKIYWWIRMEELYLSVWSRTGAQKRHVDQRH